MPKSIFHSLIVSAALGTLLVSLPMQVNAASADGFENEMFSLEKYFSPRPSVNTRLDYDAWDFVLGETVLYMGPSTRQPASRVEPQIGSRLRRGNRSRLRLEGNKILYGFMTKDVKLEMKAYKDELIALGNELDIPSLPRNEQLAYWINLHNLVLVTTILEDHPGPKRQPNSIQPIEGSDAKLHEAKLIEIDGHALSLRDIRENIVFPNWKNKDIPYAFHLGYLSSPSLANAAFTGTNLQSLLESNAKEFVNSLRAYEKGTLNPYFRDVSAWYYPGLGAELDSYFRKRMRPEVFAEYQANGIERIGNPDLSVADMTGGHGRRLLASNIQTSSTSRSALGEDIDDFLRERNEKIMTLRNEDWFKRGWVVIDDTAEDGKAPIVE